VLLDQISQIGSAVVNPEQACLLPISLNYLMASPMLCTLIPQSSICLSRNCVTGHSRECPNEHPAIHQRQAKDTKARKKKHEA